MVEHRLVARRGGSCGARTCAAGPAGVTAPVPYGPPAAAIAVYLCLGQHLPVARTASLPADLFGTPIATGTVAAWTSRAAAGLAPFTAARAGLARAELVHADETGLRVAGRRHWLQARWADDSTGMTPQQLFLLTTGGERPSGARYAGTHPIMPSPLPNQAGCRRRPVKAKPLRGGLRPALTDRLRQLEFFWEGRAEKGAFFAYNGQRSLSMQNWGGKTPPGGESAAGRHASKLALAAHRKRQNRSVATLPVSA